MSLARFEEMDFETALLIADEQHSSARERRWKFVGIIDGRLWTGVVTYRKARTRVISLRRASRNERRWYAEST